MRRVLILIIKAYRLLLSPYLGGQCRFHPTCSAYSIEAIERHGALRGSGLMVYRLARCQPFCKGGLDPVPDINHKTRNEARSAQPERLLPGK